MTNEKDNGIIGSKGFVEGNDSFENPQEKIEVETAKQLQAQIRTMLKKKYKTAFQQVMGEVRKGKTLEQIISEVQERKSNMTRIARELTVNIEKAELQTWIDEECQPKAKTGNKALANTLAAITLNNDETNDSKDNQ